MTPSSTGAHIQHSLYREGAMCWALALQTEVYILSWSIYMDPMLTEEMEKTQAELCPSKPQYPAHRWVCRLQLEHPVCQRKDQGVWELRMRSCPEPDSHTSGEFQVTAQAVQWEKEQHCIKARASSHTPENSQVSATWLRFPAVSLPSIDLPANALFPL